MDDTRPREGDPNTGFAPDESAASDPSTTEELRNTDPAEAPEVAERIAEDLQGQLDDAEEDVT